jgi:hypothetical protein
MKAIFRSTLILVTAQLVLLWVFGTAIAGLVTECDRYDWYSSSAGDIKALNVERKAFSENTRDLRQNICSKERELETELAMKTPNTKKTATLQAKISKLESELNKKRLAFMLLKALLRQQKRIW